MKSPVQEPPAQVTADGIEPKPHKTGHRLFDLIVAGSAILISCVSLFVAVQNARTQEKLVATTSWPLLQFESNNRGDQTNTNSISLVIRNAGVGPAIVKHFRVNYGGKSYANPYQLVYDCCGYEVTDPDPTKPAPGAPTNRPVESTVIKSGDAIPYFTLDFDPANAAAWHKLDEARFKLKFDACYCSVLEECWRSDLVGVDPQPVKNCPPAVPRNSP